MEMGIDLDGDGKSDVIRTGKGLKGRIVIELIELLLIHELPGDGDGDGIPDSLQSRGAARSSTLIDLSDHDKLLREASASRSPVSSHDAKGACANQHHSF